MENNSAEELRIQGNEFFKAGNYLEALESYTKAIDLNPKDSTLYSNRSLVHLKMKNYYYSNKDADMAIELNRLWPKAHFRKAEVLSEVGQYDSALLSYGRALSLQPDDRFLLQAAQRAAHLCRTQTQYEKGLPWVGAGIGIIIGVLIVLADVLATNNPTLRHPILMVLLVIVLAVIGYIIGSSIRYVQRARKKSLLEPKIDANIENEDVELQNLDKDIESEGHHSSNRTRYTKAQARLRFKKGKF